MAKTAFHCRVSTKEQNANLQRDAAIKMGVKSDNVYVEKASGSRADRPVLAKSIAACKRGDTLACYKLDRVGRSVAQAAGGPGREGARLQDRRQQHGHQRLDGHDRADVLDSQAD